MESNAPEEENKNASEEPKEMDTSPATRQTPPTPNEEKSNAKVLANLITPSRLASWERSRRTRRSVATTSTNDHRSKRLEKLKVIRKSGRSLTPANPADPPPTKKVKKNPPKVKLTESITPTVLRHSRNASVPKVKSTEEMELEEIEELKYQAKQMAKEASKSFKRALKNPSAHTPSGTPSAKLTKVKEFKFQTDNRIKSNHSMDTRSRKLSSEIDFTKGLRQHPPSPTKLKKTVVKPFNLSSNRKRKAVEPATSLKGYDFTPMAKAVMNFNKGTRVNTAKAEIRKGPMKAKLGLTVAKTPKLESRSRTRTVTVVGQKEMEDQEVEEMKNYQFKAKPVNRDILDHPGALPEVKKCPPTKPIGFNLEIDKRVEGRPVHDKAESPTKEFKARPLPTKILEGPQEVPKPEPIKPTVPQSPAFKLKNRMHLAQIRKENKENFEKEQAKAKALAEKEKNETTFKKPTVTAKKSIEKKCEVKPFSFDSRDKERFAKKEEKIKQILESEKAIASSFRATPICQPIDPVKALPAKNIKPSTEPKPFHMYSDERGALRAEKWKQEVEEEVKALREKTEFKANTNYSKVIHGKAFKPAINKKYTETFQEFALHTDRRALQREEFDEFLKHKEAESQARNEMLKMENERIEQERYERERKEAEHRANPVRKYKPVLMRQSEKELTQPQSPQFSDRFYKKC
uniref:targeting protein for Xklp2-like n=1 Tax=Styela clava TaxID=7725 RepID=UPI0019399BBC|nr:targeting protein for Xklp2-like [Styela clava]